MIDNQMRKQLRRSFARACGVCLFLTFISQPSSGDEVRDRDALIALENQWLKNEDNAGELERILASDSFIGMVAGRLSMHKRTRYEKWISRIESQMTKGISALFDVMPSSGHFGAELFRTRWPMVSWFD